MTLKPCVECGEPSADTRCPEHAGYADYAWTRLSRKARRLQPWCTDCGSIEDLQCHHLPSAWERRAQRKPLRLNDVEVLCRDCNVARGSTRPDHRPGGMGPANTVPRVTSRAKRYTPGGIR